ncbi:hypothetical protein B194_0492 [Serratia plymuthica A30]|nr:hypothetical protein B194_0492 [Serratia plymuthica A30]
MRHGVDVAGAAHRIHDCLRDLCVVLRHEISSLKIGIRIAQRRIFTAWAIRRSISMKRPQETGFTKS